MKIEALYDARTFTLTYVVFDENTKDAVVIDPVTDLDTLTWRTFKASNDRLAAFVTTHGLNLRWILETHAHADHITGMVDLKARFGAKGAIGEHITTVQKTFAGLFNLGERFPADGSQFDKLLADGETLQAGSLAVETLHTPGHTPACVTFKIGDALFTGDALFMPDFGTGRCDFPMGSSSDLYTSITDKLYTLPSQTRVFVGHDYQPNGREVAWQTTIGESRERNIQLSAGTAREDFVAMRDARDATLAPPALIVPSIQVNIRAGEMPAAEANGITYLKFPLNTLGSAK